MSSLNVATENIGESLLSPGKSKITGESPVTPEKSKTPMKSNIKSLATGEPEEYAAKEFDFAVGTKRKFLTTDTHDLAKYKEILKKEGTEVQVVPPVGITESVERKQQFSKRTM